METLKPKLEWTKTFVSPNILYGGENETRSSKTFQA